MGQKGASEFGWPATVSAPSHARFHAADKRGGTRELLGDVAGLHAPGEQCSDLTGGGVGVRRRKHARARGFHRANAILISFVPPNCRMPFSSRRYGRWNVGEGRQIFWVSLTRNPRIRTFTYGVRMDPFLLLLTSRRLSR